MNSILLQYRPSEELRSNSPMLRATTDCTCTLIVLLDTQGLVADANRVALTFIGASIERVAEVPFENTEWCNHGVNQAGRIRDAIDRASNGEIVSMEHTQCSRCGDLRILDFTITPFRSEFDTIVWLVCEGRDVTEVRRLEVERRDLEQRLYHSERLEAAGRLAVGVAHDFNNLLTVMGSGLDMLRAEASGDRLNRDLLDDMSEAVHGASALARQLLAFSRKQESASEGFAVNERTQRVAKMWQRVLSDTIVLTVELNAPDSNIRMSQGHYEQILVNLIVNAQDAMPNGGKMTLRTECKSFDSLPRHVIGQRHARGPHVVTTLTDTGCGMNSDTLHNAFDLFFTTKSEGTGFGLATVYGLVTQAGGFVTLESAPGEGTCVGIYLPSVEAEPMGTAAPQSGDRLSSTTLLVDDLEFGTA